jgi:hypothetical protein
LILSPGKAGDLLFGEIVIMYGLQCQSGDCPKNVQISPKVAPVVVQAEIYRPTLLNRILRKSRPVYAVPVLILPTETKKAEAK